MIASEPDTAFSIQEQQQAPDLFQLPLVAGAVVVIYHLSALDDNSAVNALVIANPLTMSRQLLAAIFCMQTVTQWNDPLIAQLNPVIAPYLPNTTIQFVVRKDASGSQRLFAEALLSFEPQCVGRLNATESPNCHLLLELLLLSII
jgi:ABC-type phosphate transport system substrate-binding protein